MNRFIANKGKIKENSEAKGVDVYVATSMFIQETNMQDYDDELKEFNALLVDIQKDPNRTLSDFFAE